MLIMDAALYSKVLTTGASVVLSARSKWRLSGTDRVRYLNGQVTNDVRTARADSALYACVTNVKGKIEGDVYIHAEGESLILDAPAALRESLGLRLEKYLIADDALLEDITDEWQLWHVFGPESALELPADGRRVKAQRFGLPGYDLWLPIAVAGSGSPDTQLCAEDAECLRILQRVPAYPQELNAETFPQEAALEKTAMSFAKGCYIGQEILSRIKTTGKMPRELMAWTAESGDADLVVGADLVLADKKVGQITSLTRDPQSGRTVGLGYIRQGAAAVDSVLLVGSEVFSIAASVKISALLNQ